MGQLERTEARNIDGRAPDQDTARFHGKRRDVEAGQKYAMKGARRQGLQVGQGPGAGASERISRRQRPGNGQSPSECVGQ